MRRKAARQQRKRAAIQLETPPQTPPRAAPTGVAGE
jgi:hypothetical protein